MTKKSLSYSKRGFLNKKTGLAAFEWSVEADGGYANFTISDCHRQITLDFDLDTLYHDFKKEASPKNKKRNQTEVENSLVAAQDKLDLIIDQLNQFKHCLEEVANYCVEEYYALPDKEEE